MGELKGNFVKEHKLPTKWRMFARNLRCLFFSWLIRYFTVLDITKFDNHIIILSIKQSLTSTYKEFGLWLFKELRFISGFNGAG